MAEIINLKARERNEGSLPIFHQSIALPRDLIDLDNKLDFGNYRFINQWRLDIPSNLRKVVPPKQKAILSIAHKILTRGEYTLLSPFLENKLKSKFKSDKRFNPYAYDIVKESNESTFWFDGSGYEKKFFENVLPQLLGNSFKKFVVPQVSFHSLVYDYDINSESKDSQERVDFLITTNKSKIVIELDGEEHEKQKSKDYSRTKRLLENGYKEIRIKNSDIGNFNYESIKELKKELGNLSFKDINKSDNDKFLNSFKIAHQFQVTLVELLFEGILNFSDRLKFHFNINLFDEFTKPEIDFIINESLIDLKNLIRKLCELYGLELEIEKIKLSSIENATVVITYDENIKSEKPLCVIQDISFPRIISKELKEIENIKIESEIESETLEYLLTYIFGYGSFREGQLESLKRILMNKDTITLLPTGAGKSLIFQLATLLLPGIAITIVPIKSLMQDQVENLERKGISRAIALSGDIENDQEKEKVQKLLYGGQYLLVYVAPERFLIEKFRNSLREFTKKYLISLIVIDEAHCVSEWGHDFRPAYLTVGKNSRIYCENKDGFIPPLIALTGTASENVLIDVKEDLEVKEEDSIISPETFDRKELHFNLIKCDSDDKYLEVKRIIEKDLPHKLKIDSLLDTKGKLTNSGIIFCPVTTNKGSNPRGVEFFVERINEDFGDISKPYYSDEKNRIINARDFQDNKFPLLVATKGYGMGIDKPNIRYIIHVNLPPSIEAFYQEAGRSGRDGNNSECYVVYSSEYEARNNKLMDTNISLNEVHSLCNQPHTWDDFSCLFNFHNRTFKGKNDEMSIIKGILDDIGDLEKEYQPYKSKFERIDIKLNDDELFEAKQKAIFRLTAIGVITNYGVDYASKEFSLKINKIIKENIISHYYNYVKKYNQLRAKKEKEILINQTNLGIKEFIIFCCELFLNYVYDYYEKGRRQALATMFSSLEKALKSDNPDKLFREDVSNFLKRSYSKQLVSIANSKSLDEMIIPIKEIIEGSNDPTDFSIKPISDFKSLFGQTSRTLEDFPESMGLFLLRAYTKAKINENDINQIWQDIEQFWMLSFNKYEFSKNEIYPILCWLIHQIIKLREIQGLGLSKRLIEKINDDGLTKNLIEYLDDRGISLNHGKLILINKIYKELENNIYEGK